jgi:phage replication initiation protein
LKQQEKILPPSSNTGVENTRESGLRACVDWVQATFKSLSYEQVITEVLQMNLKEFAETKNGQFGYKCGLQCGNVTVYYEGQDGMGVHLHMTGQGCRQYESLKKRSWRNLFLIMQSLDADSKFSRLDIAIDDFDGYFKIPSLIKKVKKGELSSKFKKATRIEKIAIDDGSSNGNTIYFGSPTSDIQIRMYEKNHQTEQQDEIEMWNRTEIQLRNERANAVANIIVREEEGNENLGRVIKGILAYYLEFKNKPKKTDTNKVDTNKSRWKVSPFWTKFLGDVDKLQLTQVAPDRTVEKTASWLEAQVAPSLAIMANALDKKDFEKFYKDLLENGEERLKEKDIKMIERFTNKKSSMREHREPKEINKKLS